MSTYYECSGCHKQIPSNSTHERTCGKTYSRQQEMKDREALLQEWDSSVDIYAKEEMRVSHYPYARGGRYDR